MWAAYDDWYAAFHQRVVIWSDDIACHREDQAQAVLVLPDLLACLIRLSDDATLSADQRAACQQRAQVTLAGIHMLPTDALAILSLYQDASHIAGLLAQMPPEASQQAWPSPAPLVATLAELVRPSPTDSTH